MGVHNTEHVDYIKRSHDYFVFYFIADGLLSSHDQGLQMKSKGHVFVVDDRSGSAKLNRSDKCIIGVFSLGKGAGAGDLYEQIIWAANAPRV